MEFLQRHGSRVHVIGLQGYLFEGTAVRLVRYLQLTLRHHAAGAGGGKQRAEARKGDNQRGERESLESQEGASVPNESRGDNQRAGVKRPRFMVLDLTQVHGLNETSDPHPNPNPNPNP